MDLQLTAKAGEGYITALAAQVALERGFLHRYRAAWTAFGADFDAVDLPTLACDGGDHDGEYLFDVDNGLALVRRDDQVLRVTGLGADAVLARAAVEQVQERLPMALNPDTTKIPVTFWTYSPHGPRPTLRDLDAPSWEEIVPNYATSTLGLLGKMFAPGFEPGRGGQFVLWHGRPGTGKTTALRALAREWRKWCSFHYIADPDNFFGTHADYMLDVLLSPEDVMMPAPISMGGQPEPEDDRVPASERWRVLILEDTGELLYQDARREVGQALSRFLNVVDGMIGQGLRVLVLVTTNEPLGKLHEAVTRPGRGALLVQFDELNPEEQRAWMEAHKLESEPSIDSVTLAELFGELYDFEDRPTSTQPGFA